MTPFDEDVLEQAMYSTIAWERLNDPEFVANIGVDGLERLLVQAGYSPEVVREEVMRHGWRRLEAGQKL